MSANTVMLRIYDEDMFCVICGAPIYDLHSVCILRALCYGYHSLLEL